MNQNGLLGLLGVSSGDPSKDAALNHGLLTAGLALMQSRGRLGPALGQAGMAGLMGYQQAQQQQFQQQFQQQQIEDMKAKGAERDRQAKIRDLATQFLKATKPDFMDERDIGQPGEPALPKTFDYAGYSDALAGLDPVQALQIKQATRKDETPIKLGEGDVLLDPRTRQPIASNPKQRSDPAAVQEYLFSVRQGYKGTFDQWDKDRRKAGASNSTVNVNTDKAFGTTLAEGLAKQVDNSFAVAKGAVSSIETAHRLKSAVDSGKIVAGPGASFRVLGLQLGQMLGVGGKDAAEMLSNTRTAIQGMAQAELDAATNMRGQGQITEAERDIIRRAASGDVDSLTAPEIRQLADALEKVGRSKIQAHRANVDRLGKLPAAQNIMPFYQLDEPPAYTPQGQQRVRRWNPATGKLE